jgi:hypothetical protein
MKNMRSYLVLTLITILFSFCSPIKKTSVKIPRQPYVKWYTKKSLKNYSKEFSKKDWTKKDSVFVPILDTTLFK